MLKGKSILVVVPARGGSQGIRLKNIAELCGKPLIAFTGAVVGQLDYVDRAVVSTDHDAIEQAALACGLDVPFRRPRRLAGDRIGDVDVLSHALLEMETQDKRAYDIVLMLQPTSPLRTARHVTRTVNKLVDGGYDAVWTVSPTDSKAHPLKQLVLEDDRLEYYDPRGAAIVARQQLQPLYHRNGAAYAVTRQCLLEQKSIKGQRASAVVIDESLVNIDTELDLAIAAFMIAGRATGPGSSGEGS
jgi:CMP-N-acetylneuraminic acid synthetase